MADSACVIRVAVLEDAPALGSLARELGYPNTALETENRVRRLLAAAGHRVLVAETPERKVVGWVHVFGTARLESDPFAELGGLVVSESWRGRGIGSRLVDSAAQWAIDSGYRTLRIRSRTERDGAHRLFERLGFRVVKTQCVFERCIAGNS